MMLNWHWVEESLVVVYIWHESWWISSTGCFKNKSEVVLQPISPHNKDKANYLSNNLYKSWHCTQKSLALQYKVSLLKKSLVISFSSWPLQLLSHVISWGLCSAVNWYTFGALLTIYSSRFVYVDQLKNRLVAMFMVLKEKVPARPWG